jgi:hypothetical protein
MHFACVAAAGASYARLTSLGGYMSVGRHRRPHKANAALHHQSLLVDQAFCSRRLSSHSFSSAVMFVPFLVTHSQRIVCSTRWMAPALLLRLVTQRVSQSTGRATRCTGQSKFQVLQLVATFPFSSHSLSTVCSSPPPHCHCHCQCHHPSQST